MADASERIIILSAILLVVIFVRSTQMYSKEPIYEIKIEIPENNSIGFWVDLDLNDPDKARYESAWIKALRLTVEPSPILDIVELTSEDEDVPPSLFRAISKALPEDESVKEGGPPIKDLDLFVTRAQEKVSISIEEAESIIRYLGGEIEEDRQYYDLLVNYVGCTFSIHIQFDPLVGVIEFSSESYNISREEAVVIAIESAEYKYWVDIDAKIRYIYELFDDTPIEKDVWVVHLYRAPRDAGSGSFLSVLVDPHNGTVYESELIGWATS